MISNLAIRRPVTTAMFFIGVGMMGVVSLDRLNVELMQSRAAQTAQNNPKLPPQEAAE